MNEEIMSWVRAGAVIVVLGTSSYMEISQLKMSEFYIGLAMTIVVWWFKDRGDEKRQQATSDQVVAQIKAIKEEPQK